LQLKIQINSKKPGFGRKNQFRTWSLGPTAQGTLVLSKLESKAQMTIKFWALKFEDGNEQKKCRAGAICKGMNVYCGSFNVLLILSKFVAVGFLLLPH